MRRALAGLMAGSLAAFVVAGCSEDSAEKAVEGALEDAGGGDVEFGEAPDDFPNAVPLPGGNVVSSFTTGDGAQRAWNVTFEVNDVEDAAESYRSKLEDEGFDVEDALESSGRDGTFTSFIANDGDFEVTVVAAGADDQNALSVTVTDAA